MTREQRWAQLVLSCLMSLAGDWHVHAFQVVQVADDALRLHAIAHRREAQVPDQPGCYVKMPNGCPKNPEFQALEWKHDRAGETTLRASKNKTVCEVTRKSNFANWCGTEDIQMLYVSEGGEDPTTPGCYVRAPTECPNKRQFEANSWKRDKHGEDMGDAGTNEASCLSRKETFDKWCGVTDMEMLFVPSAGSPVRKAEEPVDASESNVATTTGPSSMDMPGAGTGPAGSLPLPIARAAPPPPPKDPAMPGCYVQAPLSCPKQDSFKIGEWKKDSYGEATKEAGVLESACVARKRSFDSWCGVDNMIMRFIPESAGGSVDNAPGCYVLVPTMCPKQATFAVGRWKRDLFGESTKDAALREDSCMSRKGSFDSFCGVENTIMRFVPGPNSILGGQSDGASEGVPSTAAPLGFTTTGVPAGPSARKSEDGTDAPGCYVKVPSSCPRQPGFVADEWHRDKYGEENRNAGANEASCMARKASFDRFCGVEAAIMRFVAAGSGGAGSGDAKSAERMPDPAMPGCYVKALRSCPKQDSFKIGAWKRDSFGEANKEAGSSETACMGRKQNFDGWCGVNDMVMRYIPRGAETTIENTPGCFVILPGTCPKQSSFAVGKWKRDKHGEMNNEAAMKEDACMARKASFDSFCGVQNAIMRFVPGPDSIMSTSTLPPLGGASSDTEGEKPEEKSQEPGCYVMAEKCPKQSGFAVGKWKRDSYGEQHSNAKADVAACKARKGSFDKYCGVKDVQMRHVGLDGIISTTADDEPGCYVKAPTACPKQSTFKTGVWKRDTNADAGANADKCSERKATYDMYCGTQDTMMRFVPAGGSPAAGSDDNSEAPGCYVKVPNTCPKQSHFATGKWKHDTFGESKRNAAVSEENCKARKASFDLYCGVTDSVMRFVAGQGGAGGEAGKGAGAESTREAADAPEEPGCYFKAPSWCPKSKAFVPGAWYRDSHTPTSGNLSATEEACAARVDIYNKMCGVVDVQSRFVAPPPPRPTSFPVDIAKVQEVLPTAPADAGCYVLAPSECPNDVTFPVHKWKHDTFGETMRDAAVNEENCMTRKATFNVFCGVADILMKFVPKKNVTEEHERKVELESMPKAPGCYVKAPTSCPLEAEFPIAVWKHDTYGETVTKAATDKSTCEVDRRNFFARWCGVADIETYFVSTEGGGEEASAGGEQGAKDIRIVGKSDAKGDDADALEPGCYIRVPKSCPTQPNMPVGEWRHDSWAEENLGARKDQSACQARKRNFDRWCGITDVEVRFVEGKEDPDPSAPGCYIYAPNGCPKRPLFKVASWVHDKFGEVMMNASTERAICQEDRRRVFGKWCGTEDIRMKFIPESGAAPAEQARKDSKADALDEGVYVTGPQARARARGVATTVPMRQAAATTTLEAPARANADEEVFIPESQAGALSTTPSPMRQTTTGPAEVTEARNKVSAPPVPKTAGCYYWTPNGCPEMPDMASPMYWEHDWHGERVLAAITNQEMCKVKRQYALQKSCGETVLTYFLPADVDAGEDFLAKPQAAVAGVENEEDQQELIGLQPLHGSFRAPSMPKEPGCYVWAPEGCPAQPDFNISTWSRDVYGEDLEGADLDQDVCEKQRKAHLQEVCSTRSLMVAFVPGAVKPPPPPVAAGCYVLTPTGCPKHPTIPANSSRAENSWIRDSWGAAHQNTATDRAACMQRRLTLMGWCGVSNVKVRFVEATPALPQKPGCYVWAPSGCRDHPHFWSGEWTRDGFGERKMQAAQDKNACEVTRRGHFNRWCGVDDMRTAFVPVPPEGSEEKAELESLIGTNKALRRPNTPGCYFLIPHGCTNNTLNATHQWAHDIWGESYTDVMTNRTMCIVDRWNHYRELCQSSDVQVAWVPPRLGFYRKSEDVVGELRDRIQADWDRLLQLTVPVDAQQTPEEVKQQIDRALDAQSEDRKHGNLEAVGNGMIDTSKAWRLKSSIKEEVWVPDDYMDVEHAALERALYER